MGRYIGLFLLVLLALTGCNQSGMGIFVSVEIETAYSDATLDNNLSLTGFIETTDSYFAHAGKLYVRDEEVADEGEAPWSEIASPLDGTIIVGASNIGDNLYCVVTSIDGTTTGLYKLTVAGAASVNTPTWGARIDVDSDPGTTEDVSSVFPFGTGIGVSVQTDLYEYATYTSSDGVTFAAVTLPDTTFPVKKGVSFGGNTYVLAANRAYTNESGSYAVLNTTDSPGTSETSLTDIHVSADLGALFIISEDGTLYIHNGTAWLTPVEILEEDVTAAKCTVLSTATLDTGETILLVGSNSGYLEIVITDGVDQTDFASAEGEDSFVRVPGASDSVPSTSDADYTVVDLETAVVTDFDIVGDLLYVSTAGAGLWKVDYKNPDNWDRE